MMICCLGFSIEVQAAEGINVEYHTQEEIVKYLKNSGSNTSAKVSYEVEPSFEVPFDSGSLSDETLDSAIKMLNQIRYIAGISHDVTLSDTYNEMVQAAAMVNYVNDALSHYPSQPAGMSDDLYELGVLGARQSNIAWASWRGCSLNWTMVNSWMEDGDDSNISRVGHRRWMLNPSMSQTGFGSVYGDNGTYSAVYAFDKSNTSAGEYGVAWPAQNMPINYFGKGFPWSISMGKMVDQSSVSVTLTRKRDGKQWKFSSASADGVFYVNNDGYGQSGCIIFRPGDIDGYQPGDIFSVEIEGVSTSKVSYEVHFFDPEQSGLNKAEDGKWYYYIDGVVDNTYTGMAKNAYGWWYVTNGKLDTNYTGMAKNAYGWWYMKNGKLDQTFTGVAKNEYGYWYMQKGALAKNYTGMIQYNGKMYNVKKGKVDIN